MGTLIPVESPLLCPLENDYTPQSRLSLRSVS